MRYFRLSFIYLITFFVISLSTYTYSFASHEKVHNGKTIGIIVPLEHEAMTQIVSGIKEALIDTNVKIEVKNAHADQNIMLAIIKQMQDQAIDLIMPIGTSTSQMTISHIKNKPIICVAALIDQSTNPLITGVLDEISITDSLSEFPKLTNIAVIYSASEKIAPEIELLKAYAKTKQITLYLSMVQNLVDLPLAVQNAPEETQAFLILKDHLIVSAVNILAQEAKKRSIPVIASDEGSVKNGASFAIGVKEKDIGVESGIIAKKILQGATPIDIPYKKLDKFVVFINEKAFASQNVISNDDIAAVKMTIVKY